MPPGTRRHRARSTARAPATVVEGAERVGALVVNTPARLHHTQIEIHAVGAPWAGAHAAVGERRLGAHVHYASVFPRLDAGRYELRVLGARAGVVVPVAIGPGALVETWLDAPVD